MACVNYYLGENARFRLLDPSAFRFTGFEYFYYTSHYLWGEAPPVSNGMDTAAKLNIALWRKRCRNIPPDSAIYEALYEYYVFPHNAFREYLRVHHDTAAIAYIDFARSITALTDLVSDPWERDQEGLKQQRAACIEAALKHAVATRDDELRRRYAFLAVRLAYYNKDPAKVRAVYARYFAGRKRKNIIDYWAMHFRALAEPPGAARNYYAAQVFAHAPDKRFAIFGCYDRSVPVEKTLLFARTREQQAAVWLFEGVHRSGRALDCLEQVGLLQPQSEWADFLLLREVNKLEDWLYTPYYMRFTPSTASYEMESAYDSEAKILRRTNADRVYAAQVLAFALQHSPGRAHPVVWKMARGYLALMCRDFASARFRLNELERTSRSDSSMHAQAVLLQALCLVADQRYGHAIIPDRVKPVLMQQYRCKQQYLLLAVARELEALGNTSDAACLLAKLNPQPEEWEQIVYWRVPRSYAPYYAGFCSGYFDYIDMRYTPRQVEQLIVAVMNRSGNDSFSVWKDGEMMKEIPRLYDLLGTKYMRLNQLVNALHAFEKVNDTLWTSKNEIYSRYLDANPFYANFYNEHARTEADSFHYDKETLTRKLIGYLASAEDPSNPDRHYYYFVAANCYLNMTQYGNSWVMKRYSWTINSSECSLPDNYDYFNASLAKAYYLKAFAHARSPRFRALCLRMAGRCESYHLDYLRNREEGFFSERYSHLHDNRYYRRIQKEFPSDYEALISNCYSFEAYFRTWK